MYNFWKRRKVVIWNLAPTVDLPTSSGFTALHEIANDHTISFPHDFRMVFHTSVFFRFKPATFRFVSDFWKCSGKLQVYLRPRQLCTWNFDAFGTKNIIFQRKYRNFPSRMLIFLACGGLLENEIKKSFVLACARGKCRPLGRRKCLG